MEIVATVKAVELNRRLEIAMTAAEGLRGSAAYTLTALPDGSTRLVTDSRYDF